MVDTPTFFSIDWVLAAFKSRCLGTKSSEHVLTLDSTLDMERRPATSMMPEDAGLDSMIEMLEEPGF
jgi:hypothetical protein